MKKFTLLFLFFSLAVSAQVFPEYDPTLLKPGMKVAVKDTYEYINFYEKDNPYKNYNEQGGRFTDPATIKGRTFEITEIIKSDKQDYFLITLKDVSNQEIILYRYYTNKAIRDLSLLDTIEFPTDYFCNYIKYAADDEITFVDYQNIRFLKYLEKGKPKFTLKLTSEFIKKTSNVGTITIILKNGKQIIKKNVETKQTLVGDGRANYEALLTITTAEANLLKESEIASYDFFSLNKREPEPQIAGVIKGAADCVIKN
jgi:hypothetical protein